MDTAEKRIMEWLEDEESKHIYSNRIAFRDTFDYRYIQEYIDKYAAYYKGKEWLCLSEGLRSILDRYEGIVIAGLGQRGKALSQMLLNNGYSVSGAIDNAKGTCINIPEKINICSSREYEHKDGNCIVITPSDRCASMQIREGLAAEGVPENAMYLLSDYVSEAMHNVHDEYFDDNIIKYGKREVFIDCGVCDLWTSRRFIEEAESHGTSGMKIYGFEPDSGNYKRCVENASRIMHENANVNIELYNKGVWSREDSLNFTGGQGESSRITRESTGDTVSVTDLDSVIKDEATFIKMDIEGSELEALKGASGIIKKYRPKLAICIYHKPEDVTEIPLFVKELVPDYRLYVRTYSNNTGELVLYAV